MGAPGFDDAPTVVLREGAEWKTIRLVYPYYENPEFFSRQLDLWESYPDDVRAMLRVFVIDDGSPHAPAADVLRTRPRRPSFPFRLFRIEVDVRWNWLAARNIGMHYASEGWCVLTDMDHMIPATTARRLITCKHDPSVIYRFTRHEHTGQLIHPHPNSMFMTREMFWRVGGYDEALSGFYGTDGDWRRRCAATARVLTLSDTLERHEHVGDSSTRAYLRKQPQDAGKKPLLTLRKNNPSWRPRTMSFPHHEVPL